LDAGPEAGVTKKKETLNEHGAALNVFGIPRIRDWAPGAGRF